MDFKELLEDIPRGILIAWGVGAVLSCTISGLIVWALIKYIST